jgi:hypothetical protein
MAVSMFTIVRCSFAYFLSSYALPVLGGVAGGSELGIAPGGTREEAAGGDFVLVLRGGPAVFGAACTGSTGGGTRCSTASIARGSAGGGDERAGEEEVGGADPVSGASR